MVAVILDYIKFFLLSKFQFSKKNLFVEDFKKAVINDISNKVDFSDIESKRKELLQNKDVITLRDFGAGSQKSNSMSRAIASIAKHSLSTPYQCRVLYRLIKHFNLKNILELGTSLGISTAYLAKSNNEAKVISLDGDPAIHEIAEKNLKDLDVNNILLVTGDFKVTLDKVLEESKNETFDLAFIDGNHKRASTISYFDKILNHADDEIIIVVDDIYWSEEMKEAWKAIKKHPQIDLSIDLFFCGIVFTSRKKTKARHYKISPARTFYFLE